MKKLMIAATLAAMTAGAFAEKATEYVYDFTASVKSTGAKEGKSTKYTWTVNLGCDKDADESYSEADWWYEDGAFDAVISEDATYGDKWADAAGDQAAMLNVAKAYVDSLVAAKNYEQLAEVAFSVGELTFNDKGKTVYETIYNTKNQQKKWCTTFKVILTTDPICYRVAKSYKLKDQFIVWDDCCGTFDGWNSSKAGFIGNTLLQRFGSDTREKCTKSEAYSYVEQYDDAGAFYWGWAAGQGKYDNKVGLNTVSGNIVGLRDAPQCPGCCGDDIDAIVFGCDGYAVEAAPTAFYGTYSIKYNKKESDKLNK